MIRKRARTLYDALADAMQRGLVNACHDCSDGGFAVAAAEMAFAGGLGMHLDLRAMPRAADVTRNDTLLFSETASRFVVTVPAAHRAAFRDIMPAGSCGEIGSVHDAPEFMVTGLGGDVVIASRINELKAAWQRPLDLVSGVLTCCLPCIIREAVMRS